jgi:hypothetical protein
MSRSPLPRNPLPPALGPHGMGTRIGQISPPAGVPDWSAKSHDGDLSALSEGCEWVGWGGCAWGGGWHCGWGVGVGGFGEVRLLAEVMAWEEVGGLGPRWGK